MIRNILYRRPPRFAPFGFFVYRARGQIILSTGDHRQKKYFSVIRYQGGFKIRPGDIAVIEPYHRTMTAAIYFIEKVGHGHALPPGMIIAVGDNHYTTPLALRTSRTSGKSIPSRLAVATVGMPSRVHPRRSYTAVVSFSY